MPAAPKDLATKPGFTMLNVSVADAARQPINGLKQSDFEAYSKVMGYPIAYFHTDNGAAPESIALVIDTSGGVQPYRGQEGARRFFRQALPLRRSRGVRVLGSPLSPLALYH